MVRIFTACHGTQLLVIQHLRCHLQLPRAREFLLWNPLSNVPWTDSFMRHVIDTAGFADTLDMRHFASLEPRTQGPVAWWFESARRLRRDSGTVRAWMMHNGIEEADVDLWADDPIHFNVTFPKGLFQQARQVKFPHCFNLEDSTSVNFKDRLVAKHHAARWTKTHLYWPWLRWVSGVDMWSERIFAYDVAYSFDKPSCWARESVDVSHLINTESFRKTYHSLPATLRNEVESILAPIRGSRKPLVLLLLFGLSPEARQVYQDSLLRIFFERRGELSDCSLAIKVHPGAAGVEEERLFDWVENNISAEIFPMRTVLNLEFILPELRPDYVLAGPCGALPVVKRLGVARPILIPEVLEHLSGAFPDERSDYLNLVRDIERW